MKKIKLFIPFLTVMITAISFPINAFAKETPESSVPVQSEVNSSLTNEETSIANQYISYDKTKKSFVVNDNIRLALPKDKVDAVLQQVSQTNFQISIAKTDIYSNSAVADPSGEITNINTASLTPEPRANGVTSITIYWNYELVKISRNTLRGIGTGVTLAGIWIPEPVVSKVCASLGVVVGLAPHGIWFHYNHFYRTFTNFGWQ